MRTRSVVVATAAVLAAALLGACGGESGGPEPSPSTEAPGTPTPPASPSPPTTAPPTTEPVPPGQPPLSPPVVVPPPTDRPGQTTLSGQVYAGVEAGCRLLRTESGDYLLIGQAAESAQLGSTVTVRGQVRADMATTCQQGTPFEVSEVLD
ncbi:MAG: hypothetical protein GEV12_01130 [Micromonosporaceae bacterium]|nr:hypothetical protein [Micromonosporaceae bacterium]